MGSKLNIFRSLVGSKAAKVSLAAALAGSILVVPFEGSHKVNGVHTVYVDPVGILTSCYGHTGPELRKGQTFTEQECLDQLAVDLVKHEKLVDNVLKREVPIWTKAAVISFTYNVGGGNLRNSTLLKDLNAGRIEKACRELVRWVYANKKKLPGLVRRRGDEMAVCLGQVDFKLELGKDYEVIYQNSRKP